MSTTTFMETFDTQMFDSGDGDIPMYTGPRPAESWFSVEATMADEGSNTSIQPYHTEQSVEIEMADHDDEIIEYEMADEREYARDNDTEVADVDLVDVSRQTSPPPGLSVLSTPHIHSDAVPSYERAPSLASFGPSVDSARPDEVIERFVVPQATDDVAPATVTQVDSSPSDERAVPAVEDAQQVPDSTTTLLAPMNDAGVRLLGENTTTETADREAEAASDLANGGETSRYEAASEQTSATEDKDGSSNPQLVDRLSSPNVPSLPTTQGEILTEDPHEVEVLHLDRQNDAAPEPETVVVENGGLGTDPHEISEGVYIDPPPAVLLTISSSSQPLECCLFNQPVRSPGSQSPSTSSAVEHALMLLLHHRPTLYYEPLSVVFDALRQEEHIQNVYDLERDELVLDAYDLQLVISEDNVHVHEVTLHDLNVLHDGADLTGPLRLELRVIPRFIARYNALREQIARLDLAVEEEQSYEDEPVYEHHGEEERVTTNEAHDFEGQNDLNEGEQGQEQEGEEYAQENTGEQEATSHEQEDYGETQPDDAPVPKTAQEDSGQHKQGVQEPRQDEYDGTQDEAQDQDAPYESGDVQEYVDENVPNAGGDVLDADEVHRFADADEGGDYVDDKDVAPEDDEQQFGEGLPEDFGGEPETDPDDRHAFKDQEATDVDEANPVPSEGIDVLETPAFLSSDFATVPEDQYDAEQRDEDGFTDAGETLRTDISGPAQEDNESVNRFTGNIDGDFEEYDDEPTNGSAIINDPSSNSADVGDEEWTFESPERDSAALPSAEHDISRKPSTMSSSSRSSKRGHDEVEFDEYEDDEGSSYPQGSPDVKKARIQ